MDALRRESASGPPVIQFALIVALVTLALMIAGGIVLARHLGDAVKEQAENDLARQAETVAGRVATSLAADDLSQPMTGTRYEEFDSFLESYVIDARTARIKIWNTDGTIVFSDHADEVGQTFPVNGELGAALNGETSSELSDLSDAENVGERQFESLLEVYTPLRLQGSPAIVGAFEVYENYSGVEALSSKIGTTIDFGVAAMLAFVYLPTTSLLIRGAVTIRRREAQLGQANSELSVANERLRERYRQLTEARAQAATDALTGMGNHRAFQKKIRETIATGPGAAAPLGLVMLDIDGFKTVNDIHGHLAGDEILRDCGAAIATVVPSENAFRYGGDEFAVLLPGSSEPEAEEIAERLRRAIIEREHAAIGRITVSLGVASYPETVVSTAELIYGADAAMYVAKSGGKNRVCRWSAVKSEGADAHLAVHSTIRNR